LIFFHLIFNVSKTCFNNSFTTLRKFRYLSDLLPALREARLSAVMIREVAGFVQSKFRELRISEARYEDLLSEVDEHYPRYIEKLRELFNSSNIAKNRE